MNNHLKKTSIISIMLIVAVSMLSGCTLSESEDVKKVSDNVVAENSNIDINKNKAKVLEISKPEVLDENVGDNLIETKTKVKNISDYNIRNIELTFREFDKDNNALSKTEALSKITLLPGESAYIQSAHKKYAQSAEVTSYAYNVSDKLVNVNLSTNEVNIVNTKEKIVNDKKYNILGISEPKITNKVDGGYHAQITIKNMSDKDIGSVILEIAELNDKNEYTNVSYLDSYDVIKKSQEIQLNSVHSDDAKKLEVIGYIYDDVSNNSTVEVNLKLNESILMK